MGELGLATGLIAPRVSHSIRVFVHSKPSAAFGISYLLSSPLLSCTCGTNQINNKHNAAVSHGDGENHGLFHSTRTSTP